MEELPFDVQVYALVRAIPAGKVATYGELALMLGTPHWARRVGRALRSAPTGVPCHRVVNRQGRTAPGFARQRELLEAEGVVFTAAGFVDLKRCLYKIPTSVFIG